MRYPLLMWGQGFGPAAGLPPGASLLLTLFLCAGLSSAQIVEAAKQGDTPALRTLIKQHADVNTPGPDGMTALDWAARSNDLDMARLLIDAGANVKFANRYGITPLSLAATNGSAPMIELLLKAGADPNTALPEGETVLMTAARTGDPAAIKLLLSHDAKVNARENTLGETALMWAAAENHPEAIKALLEGGADINARSTILSLAPFKWVTSGMVSTTLPRGGWTPLMYAARQNSSEAVRVLADAKADLNLTDPDGTTALVFAIINAHFDLAAMLLDKGADPERRRRNRHGGLVRRCRYAYSGADDQQACAKVGRQARCRRSRQAPPGPRRESERPAPQARNWQASRWGRPIHGRRHNAVHARH